MRIDTTTVRLVLAVMEEGSISRAADKLGTAVAAASRRLSDLEEQLGAKLFLRGPNGAEITESGANLLKHLRQIDNLVHRLAGDAQAFRNGLVGRVVIGAPRAVIIQSLAHDLAHIRHKYPGISLQIVEENSRIVQQLLRDKVIDVGIYEKKSGFFDYAKAPYHNDRLVLVYSRAHFQFPDAPLGIDDMLELPLITLGKGSAILSAVQRLFRSRGRQFTNHLGAAGFDTMHALVLHGLGVGLMPPEVLSNFRPEAVLGHTELQGDWHQRSYVLSHIEEQTPPQILQNVVAELLRERRPS